MLREMCHLNIGDAACSQPQVGKFVRQCQHLRRPAVRSVDEDQRGQIVGQRKAAKLFHPQLATGVASHNAVCHDQDACVFSMGGKLAQGYFPGGQVFAFLQRNFQCAAHGFRHRRRCAVSCSAANEIQRWKAVYAGMVAIPVLPLLTEVQGVQQVGTGACRIAPCHSAKVGYGQLFLHGGRQEEIPDRHMHGTGESFQLLQSWPPFTGFPCSKTGEVPGQHRCIHAGAFTGPDQQCRIDGSVRVHPDLPGRFSCCTEFPMG